MRQSDIWNSFIKIAEEKGMISKDAPEKAKKTLEQNPRWGSDTKEKIEKLYNLKPEITKGMEYDKNISYYAHPNPVIIAPSYDKLNGLVENINERQNILLNIVNKNNDGLLTQHKYAEKDLLLTLVKIGNDLDNRSQDELRVLADACLFQISKPMKKVAFPFLIAGIAALVGALYVQQHIDDFDQGFEENHRRLSGELDDFLKSNDNFGIGVTYKPEFLSVVQDFKAKLDNFYNLYQAAVPIIREVELPKTAQMSQAALKLVNDPVGQKAIQAYNSLKAAVSNFMPYLQQIMREFGNEAYKARQIQEKGFFTSLIDKTQFLHGGKGLISDDFDDVKQAIPPYLQSIQELAGALQTATQYQNNLQTQMQEAATQSDQMFGGEGGAPEEAPSAPSGGNKGMFASFDQGAEDLAKEFGM